MKYVVGMNNALKVTTKNNDNRLTRACDHINELRSDFIKSLTIDQKKMIRLIHETNDELYHWSFGAKLDELVEEEINISKQALNLTDIGEHLMVENRDW
jgi:hypothetical protein